MTNAPGKHVPSVVPGRGPSDLSGNLTAHRDRPDAGPTRPAGGYPETVGGNPDAPAQREQSDTSGQPSQSPADQNPWSEATEWGPAGITGAIY